MTKREPKPKLSIPTRTARPKGDMFNNLRRPEEVESLSIEEIVGPQEPTEEASSHLRPPEVAQGGLRPPKVVRGNSIAPMRDFNKRANSLDRVALPSGLFPGSSKKLYDALYVRTLGAVVPVKAVQATRRELSKWSGIKNVKTIAAHLRHLTTVGLIAHHWDTGSNDGSIYEVRLPEEADGLRPPQTTQGGSGTPEVALDRISGLPLDQDSASGGLSQAIDSQVPSGDSKTSSKTNTEKIDDEAFAPLVRRLREAVNKVTGKDFSAAEAERWGELAGVLVAELEIAAARTTVSSVPSFLAEHLRRRLWKIDKKQARAEGRELPDEKAASAQGKDARACPDCGGSGFWYPDGYEKGVAKCRHEKLADVARTQ